jgi:hypothetical protein
MSRLDPQGVAALVTMTIQIARGRLGCLDVPMLVFKLADGGFECVSPQHARADRDELAFALIRQARYLVGDKRFEALIVNARADALRSS